MRYPVRRRATFALVAVASVVSSLAVSAVPARAQGGGGTSLITSSNAGPNPFNGLNINAFLGADRFYNAGYTGARAVIANVEGGHIWNGHETLTHVTTFVDARTIPPYSNLQVGAGQLGQFDFHATYIGTILAGRDNGLGNPTLRQGIASGANLWSGAIATSWNAPQVNQRDFQWNTGFAFAHPYTVFAQTGINGRTADVINSSWSYFNPAGTDQFSRGIDGLASQNRTPIVFAAGNDGAFGADTVDLPGAGDNTIVVGSTTSDTSNPVYGTVAAFSGRSPSAYNGPDGTVANARARVDLVAPGTNITLPLYGGQTGGNAAAPNDPTGGAGNQYVTGPAGTSLSAPMVSGGIGLLADVAYDRFAANIDNATDGNVLKAVLLNSATKLNGWTNNLAVNNQGVQVTTQALDFTQGAGQLNLNRAFDQFTAGVTDVPGTTGGTNLSLIGWDWGTVAENGFNDYRFASSLVAGSTFTASLNWYVKTAFSGVDASGNLTTSFGSFTNLALELYQIVGGNPQLVAQSDAAYIATEHFTFAIPTTADYLLRVRWIGERYDFINSNSQNYGLAWSVTAAPEPGTFLFLGIGALTLGLFRRARQNP